MRGVDPSALAVAATLPPFAASACESRSASNAAVATFKLSPRHTYLGRVWRFSQRRTGSGRSSHSTSAPNDTSSASARAFAFSAGEVHGYASSASLASLDQLLSTKLLVCLDVDLVRLADDLVWQLWRGWLAVEAYLVKPVAHELLV